MDEVVDWHTGRLLVANPVLGDPNFHRTVVLVLEHGVHGAVGVVLNRLSPMLVSDVVPGLRDLAVGPGVVHVGGPVQPEAAICLARLHRAHGGDGVSHLFGGIGSVDMDRYPQGMSEAASAVRLFAGYAGWEGGQLESEIADGGWFVVDREESDAFSTDPEALWRGVLRRQRRSSLAMLGSFPENARLN